MDSLSFDGLVNLYDETRVFDPHSFELALGFLNERFPPAAFCRWLEPGVGTGRIAWSLARCGYHITGVDISQEMLAALQRRSRQCYAPPIAVQRANVTALPFADGAFDIAIAVHLFYFVPDWQRAADELVRVTRQDGAVILMHTGTGAEVPFLNEQYKALCEAAGYAASERGVKSTHQVVDYLSDCGCAAEWIRDRWMWTTRLRLDKALEYIQTRAYSFTALTPEVVHQATIEKLVAEMQAQYGNLGVEIQVPNQVYLVVIQRRPQIFRWDAGV